MKRTCPKNKGFGGTSPAPMGRRAFTLIELLVVISIITLLVSILLPALNRARQLSKQVVCMTNVSALCKGLAMYEVANPGWLPLAVAEWVEGLPEDTPLIVDEMKEYVENPEAWRCPSDDQGLFEDKNRRNSYDYLGVLLTTAAGGMSTADLAEVRKQLLEYAKEIPIIVDAEAFHPSTGKPETRNYGFLDGHVEFTDEFQEVYEQYRQETGE